VADAYLIVRHLGLPDGPREPRTAIDRAGCVAELRDVKEFLRRAMAGDEAPDGLVREGLLRWQGRSYDIPRGAISRLIGYLWDRESATFDELNQHVFESPQGNPSLSSRTREASGILRAHGIPWRLSVRTADRLVKRCSLDAEPRT
jgi:hypothetical protein